jgi:hypothetical protein
MDAANSHLRARWKRRGRGSPIGESAKCIAESEFQCALSDVCHMTQRWRGQRGRIVFGQEVDGARIANDTAPLLESEGAGKRASLHLRE